MQFFSDYIVPWRSVESIVELAWQLNDKCKRLLGPGFQLSDVIERVVPTLRADLKDLTVEVVDDYYDIGVDAFVDFSSSKLYVFRKIWDGAKSGDGHSCKVLAHELGHLVMHNSAAVPYTAARDQKQSNVSDEQRAEPQASIFSAFFLVPRHVLEKYKKPEEIEYAALVDPEIAEIAIKIFGKHRYLGKSKSIAGQMCCHYCDSSEMIMDRTVVTCGACGKGSYCC